MINYLLGFRVNRITRDPPQKALIEESSKVLFALFTRYGDTIISLVVIKEFIDRYPDKEYLILCPRQMLPFVNEFLPRHKCISLNKRNLIDMIKVVRILRRERFDVGFNPWSNGIDSCYFLTYCSSYMCYKNFVRPKKINHYQVVRKYLMLPEKDWMLKSVNLSNKYRNILICPESTDHERSMKRESIDELRSKYRGANVTVAALDKYFLDGDYNTFAFRKTAESSEKFIELVKSSDLMICVDSGPLHISAELGRDLLAVFYVTDPGIVLNTGTKLMIG